MEKERHVTLFTLMRYFAMNAWRSKGHLLADIDTVCHQPHNTHSQSECVLHLYITYIPFIDRPRRMCVVWCGSTMNDRVSSLPLVTSTRKPARVAKSR